MKHIDHQTLELYILKSASVDKKRRTLARHLAVCEHCRSIADEISLIYTEAETHIKQIDLVPFKAHAVMKEWNERITPAYGIPSLTKVSSSLVGKLAGFARSHPVKTSVGAVVSLAFLAVGTSNLVSWSIRTTNPAKVHYDTSRDVLEVYDEKENLLWHKPSQGLRNLQEWEGAMGSHFAVIGDLDGRGRNQVITMLPIESPNSQPISNSLRIYDSNGDVIVSKPLGDKVGFEGRIYEATPFWGGGLALVRSPNRAGMEVVASAEHYRSPSVVARVNGRGDLLGEYWHFGHLFCTQTVHSASASGEEVILIGSNDVDSSSGRKFPVIVVLDPSKISGRSEATATRGFGFPASMAEVVYIRIPTSDMDDAIHAVLKVAKFMPGDGKHWSFIVTGNDITDASSFEYVFDSDWRIESVLSSDTNAWARERMRKKGLVHGQIDQRYLDALKNSVEYWDGQEWTKDFILVHSIPAPE